MCEQVYVPGDKIPVYEETLEDLRRSNETPALPFNAYGTLAMARTEFDENSASSQVREGGSETLTQFAETLRFADTYRVVSGYRALLGDSTAILSCEKSFLAQ